MPINLSKRYELNILNLKGICEDGVQYFCAKEAKADLIISNNKKDFTLSEIEVFSPVEFGLLYLD